MWTKSKKLFVLAAVLLVLGGCATFMPNTADVLEPKGFEDLAIAVGADIEMLIDLVRNYWWLGLFIP